MGEEWKKVWKDLSFEELVCMYISDCKQYLSGEGFEKEMCPQTTDQDVIYDNLRELKDMCMRKAGQVPFKWEKLVK